MSELRLKKGKRYVRRDGTITPKLIKNGVFLHDTETDFLFMENNSFVTIESHPKDLISEYIDNNIKDSAEEVIDDKSFDLETFYAKRHAVELALKIAAKKSGNVSEILSGAGKILQFIEDNMPSK